MEWFFCITYSLLLNLEKLENQLNTSYTTVNNDYSSVQG